MSPLLSPPLLIFSLALLLGIILILILLPLPVLLLPSGYGINQPSWLQTKPEQKSWNIYLQSPCPSFSEV